MKYYIDEWTSHFQNYCFLNVARYKEFSAYSLVRKKLNFRYSNVISLTCDFKIHYIQRFDGEENSIQLSFFQKKIRR